MKHTLLIASLLLTSMPFVAEARPISYPGGWTFLSENSHMGNEVTLHYSFTSSDSLGAFAGFNNEEETRYSGMRWTHLVSRKNTKDSQANLYVIGAVGAIEGETPTDDSKTNMLLSSGVMADWETRRWLVAYHLMGNYAGDIKTDVMQTARVGVAPYIAEFGSIHTWLMLQLEHEPSMRDEFTVTPLVRVFTGPHLAEFGISNHGDALANYIVRF